MDLEAPGAGEVPWELLQSLRELWRLPATSGSLASMESFKQLVRVCNGLYGVPKGSGMELAMEYALRSLGMPALVPKDGKAVPGCLAESARQLDEAFSSSEALKTYLCPLDLADDVPPLQFGPAEVRTFSRKELEVLFRQPVLQRWGVGREVDFERLRQFTWLVVREPYRPHVHPGTRAFPILADMLIGPFGHIQPHRPKHPAILEDVLLMLLLAPWEDCGESLPFEWRPFRIPWVYTIDDDLFVAPPPRPDAGALTWTYRTLPTEDGETLDVEVPEVLWLDQAKVGGVVSGLTDAAWRALQQSKQSPLFTGPLRHFLTHAFSVDDIDEFLAHMLVVEAGLGLVSDFPIPKAKRPPGSAPKTAPGGKAAIHKRLVGLLGDPGAADTFDALYEERSAYLHGREMPAGISGTSSIEARRLARRVAAALMAATGSVAPGATRESFLGQWTP